jgi:hypothetical protein
VLANSRDTDLLESMTTTAWEGRTVEVVASDDANEVR